MEGRATKAARSVRRRVISIRPCHSRPKNAALTGWPRGSFRWGRAFIYRKSETDFQASNLRRRSSGSFPVFIGYSDG